MSITDRSYVSINKILEKLEESPSELILKNARFYIKSILTTDKKDNSSVRCWDSGYDFNYLLFAMTNLSGETTEQIAELQSIMVFKKVEVVVHTERRESDNPELDMLTPLVNSITPLLTGLNNAMSQYQNPQPLLEDVPVTETVD